MTLTIEVTDPELIDAIKAWENGADYTLNVTQDSPRQFTATAAEEALEEVEPEAVEETPEPSDMAKKSPGIAMMMAKPAK